MLDSPIVLRSTISEYVSNIYECGELYRESTVRKFRTVQKEGIREVSRESNFYNLDAIISLGYRVNSSKATQFRIWAIQTLKEYVIKGFVLDDDRLKEAKTLFGKDHFKELLQSYVLLLYWVYLAHDLNNKNTLSLGVSIYDAFLQGGKITPLIIDYKHYFKEEDNSLFANAGIGYTLFSPSDINSMIFKIGLGYRFSISKSKRMHIGINYDFNKLYDIFTFENNSSFSTKMVDVNVYAFNVKIGIVF